MIEKPLLGKAPKYKLVRTSWRQVVFPSLISSDFLEEGDIPGGYFRIGMTDYMTDSVYVAHWSVWLFWAIVALIGRVMRRLTIWAFAPMQLASRGDWELRRVEDNQ